jgi:hypothetical protein
MPQTSDRSYVNCQGALATENVARVFFRSVVKNYLLSKLVAMLIGLTPKI